MSSMDTGLDLTANRSSYYLKEEDDDDDAIKEVPERYHIGMTEFADD